MYSEPHWTVMIPTDEMNIQMLLPLASFLIFFFFFNCSMPYPVFFCNYTDLSFVNRTDFIRVFAFIAREERELETVKSWRREFFQLTFTCRQSETVKNQDSRTLELSLVSHYKCKKSISVQTVHTDFDSLICLYDSKPDSWMIVKMFVFLFKISGESKQMSISELTVHLGFWTKKITSYCKQDIRYEQKRSVYNVW